MTLSHLIERLEGAEEGSRELDIEVWKTLTEGKIPEHELSEYFDHIPDKEECWLDQNVDHYSDVTFSVDAAIKVMHEHLPGWYWRTGYGSSGQWVQGKLRGGWCHLNRVHPNTSHPEDEATGYASTAPLAILVALLKALQAQGEQG